jgi:hypothetical protein
MTASVVVREGPPRCRTLAEYIEQLVARLAQNEPVLHARLRDVVGSRRARITLDDETVEVQFEGGQLSVSEVTSGNAVDGVGACDRMTTLALLRGELEVRDAILDGRLRAMGELDSLARMFHAIEILLDAAARLPAVQRLALDYGVDPCRPARPPYRSVMQPRRVVIDPDHVPALERALLRRLDLLP